MEALDMDVAPHDTLPTTRMLSLVEVLPTGGSLVPRLSSQIPVYIN